MLKVGDRVKLTDQIAKNLKAVKPRRIDWSKRRGSVVSFAKVADSVGVHWDDRKTADFWPQRALELE